jgi:DNA-binding protein HU-beta
MIKAKKDDIVAVVAIKTEMTQKDIKEIYDAIFETIEECILKGYSVPLGKVGSLVVRNVQAQPAKERLNPATMEKFMCDAIPEHNKVGFKASKNMKETLKQKTLGNPFDI